MWLFFAVPILFLLVQLGYLFYTIKKMKKQEQEILRFLPKRDGVENFGVRKVLAEQDITHKKGNIHYP